MSVQAMAWVFEHSRARLADRLVLLAIANEANAAGLESFPGQRRIAEHSHVSRVTVRRSVARLEGAGELLVLRPDQQGRGRFTRYAIVGNRDPFTLADALGWPAPQLDEEILAEFSAPVENEPDGDPEGSIPPLDGHTPEGAQIDALPGRGQTSTGRGSSQTERGSLADAKGSTLGMPDPSYPSDPKDPASDQPSAKCERCHDSRWVPDFTDGDQVLACPVCAGGDPDDPRAQEPEPGAAATDFIAAAKVHQRGGLAAAVVPTNEKVG